MSTTSSRFRRERGVALVMVMWVVIVGGLMLLGVLKVSRTNRALAHDEFAAVEAHWLARAGVEQAMAVLEDDDRTVDSTLEDWYQNASIFDKVQLGSGWFAVRSASDNSRPGLDDESARLNLNAADKRQLTELKTLDDTQIDSLIDWRNSGDTPSGNGAKAGYYQHLRFGYEMRGKEFQTHRELLLVRGFEDRSFFGPPGVSLASGGPAARTTVYSYQPNRDPKGSPRININQATAQAMQDRFNFTPQLAQAVVQGRSSQPYQRLTSLLDVRPQQGSGTSAPQGTPSGGGTPITQITIEWLGAHVDEIALNGDTRLAGKININTASREVLMTLPGITDELADRIIAQRASADGAFSTLADLLGRRVLSQDVFRNLFDQITVRSDVFTVESLGVSASGVERRILAVIDRGSDPERIIYWYQTP